MFIYIYLYILKNITKNVKIKIHESSDMLENRETIKWMCSLKKFLTKIKQATDEWKTLPYLSCQNEGLKLQGIYHTYTI